MDYDADEIDDDDFNPEENQDDDLGDDLDDEDLYDQLSPAELDELLADDDNSIASSLPSLPPCSDVDSSDEEDDDDDEDDSSWGPGGPDDTSDDDSSLGDTDDDSPPPLVRHNPRPARARVPIERLGTQALNYPGVNSRRSALKVKKRTAKHKVNRNHGPAVVYLEACHNLVAEEIRDTAHDMEYTDELACVLAHYITEINARTTTEGASFGQ